MTGIRQLTFEEVKEHTRSDGTFVRETKTTSSGVSTLRMTICSNAVVTPRAGQASLVVGSGALARLWLAPPAGIPVHASPGPPTGPSGVWSRPTFHAVLVGSQRPPAVIFGCGSSGASPQVLPPRPPY